MNGQVFRRRQVRNPQPRCMPQLDGDVQNPIKGVQKWQLHHHRQASAERIHAFALVQLHHFLVLFLLPRIPQTDILIAFVYRLDLRLQTLHFTRRFQTREPERKQRQVNDERDDDDGPAVIICPMIVGPVKPKKQRLGDDAEKSPIHDLAELRIYFFENLDVFRADEKGEIILRPRRKAAADKSRGAAFIRPLDFVAVSPDLQLLRILWERNSRKKIVL